MRVPRGTPTTHDTIGTTSDVAWTELPIDPGVIVVSLNGRVSGMMDLVRISQALVNDLEPLAFGPPVTHVYNPLVYARAPHTRYLRLHGEAPCDVFMFGMNPGPWGMVQTGIPFGEVSFVRDWLGIDEPIGKPPVEHPKRPVLGLDCSRSEVSGRRVWGWARDIFDTPGRFFERFFIANYCPLAFMELSGRNRTPDKLPAAERESLFAACDQALRRTVEYLQPRFVVGIGAFAETRARVAVGDLPVAIHRILHPSPASPPANKNWAGTISRQLVEFGIDLPGVQPK